jgi:peptidyl-prolyl cis-trans isomerase B (cyclophilin B)
MNKRFNRLLTFFLLCLISSCNTPGNDKNITVLIKTNAGDITILLYDGTPLHKENFIKLINTGFYEGVSFHRVIRDFMIQAGDPLTKPDSGNLPDTIHHYTIPAEFVPEYFHKKGALAAARQGNDVNPYMRSSGTQFYIVQGKRYTDEELDIMEQRIRSQIKQAKFSILINETADSLRSAGLNVNDAEIQEIASVRMFEYLTATPEFKLTPEQRSTYINTGGTPRLDATYTVFGEVTEGLDIVDRIASEKTDPSDRPLNNITILKTKVLRK